MRLQSAEPEPLIELADHILNTWQGNSDNGSSRPAEAGGTPRNTAAATARQQDGRFVLDLILLHHLTAEPLPLEASHSEHPHMLGEAPGLTEVMGLAVLPAPLKAELASLEEAILKRKDIRSDPVLAKHADWIDRLKGQYVFTAATTREILLRGDRQGLLSHPGGCQRLPPHRRRTGHLPPLPHHGRRNLVKRACMVGHIPIPCRP